MVRPRPAVDFFLRNLVFDFSDTDVVGLPGGMIGIEAPLNSECFAWFIHEAEHLTQLAYPVGLVCTAMSVRALDLYRDAARSATDLTDSGFLKTLQAYDRAGDFVLVIHQFAEWLKPLLEGLALLAELEIAHIDGDHLTHAMDAATTLQVHQWVPLLMRTTKGRNALTRLSAGDPAALDEIWTAAERQLAHSRALRIGGDLIDSIFWAPPDRESTLPYFYGYLFVKRLEQAWREKVPTLTPRRAYELMTVAICSTLAYTFVPLCTHWQIETARPAWKIGQVMRLLLEALPALSATAIEQLGSSGTSWRLDLEGGLLPIATNVPPERRLAVVISEVIPHVFGFRSFTPEVKKTFEVLRDIEDSKFIVPTALREVVAAAIDEEEGQLVLVDLQRVRDLHRGKTSGVLDRRTVTFFRFESGALRTFATALSIDLSQLPRVRSDELPFRVSVQDRFWTVLLITYMHYWPNGFGEEAVRPLRVLASGPGGELLYEAGVEENERKQRAIRHYTNVVMRDSLQKALSPSFEAVQRAVSLMDGIFESGSHLERARALLQTTYNETAIQQVSERVRAWFGEIIFGDDVTLAAIEERRFEILTSALAHDDVAVLRRLMQNGLVFPRKTARRTESTPKEMRDAVDRIRAVAQEKLGIPLLRWNETESDIELDFARSGKSVLRTSHD